MSTTVNTRKIFHYISKGNFGTHRFEIFPVKFVDERISDQKNSFTRFEMLVKLPHSTEVDHVSKLVLGFEAEDSSGCCVQIFEVISFPASIQSVM